METPLTTSQELLWMGEQLDPGTPLYNMVFAWFLHGDIDQSAFQRAFAQLLQQTDALRLRFASHDSEVWQWDSQDCGGRLEFIDFSAIADPRAEFYQWARSQAGRPFDLTQQVYHSTLIKLQDKEFVWYLNQHHLITDAASCDLLFTRMSSLYLQELEIQSGAVSSATGQTTAPLFLEHAQREQTIRQQPGSQRALQYWRANAEKRPAKLTFYGRSDAPKTVQAKRYVVSLTAHQSARLKQLATNPDMRALTEHLSLFNLFAALLTALLARVTGEATQQLGILMHNRATPRSRATAGLLIETCPLQLRVDEADTLQSLVAKIKAAVQAGLRHVKPGVSRATVDRPVAVIFNYLPVCFDSFAGLRASADWIHPLAADPAHKLRLQVHDFNNSGCYQLLFELNEAVFEAADANRILAHFKRLLDGCLNAPRLPIADIDLLGEQERLQRQRDFNNTTQDFPVGSGVLARFGQHVRSTPHAPAVWVANASQAQLTYAQLDSRANQLARLLLAKGVACNSIVPVLMQRSADLLVALLGVLKAGAAYLPLDAEHPRERNADILNELAASPTVQLGPLLTQNCYVSGLTDCACEAIALDAEWPAHAEKTSAPGVSRNTDDLAYVIYTSGSTGKPKGVLIHDRNLSNYVNWASRYYLGDKPGDLPLFTSLAFDLTVTSIFLPLTTGGCVHVYHSPEGGGLLELPQILADDRVDLIKLTPSHLALLKDNLLETSRLRGLILGGEILTRETAEWVEQKWRGRVAVFNEYGPTEATVGCMIHRYDADRDGMPSVPIGMPVANTQIHVLDNSQRPVATGVVGELCVGGYGVASGYLLREQLTAERFVNNPFGDGKLYKTGDLARCSDDNRIEFLGRSDRQVKVHGARIELDEIAAVLQQHPAITACVVELRHKARQAAYNRSIASQRPVHAHNAHESESTSTGSAVSASEEVPLLVAYYVESTPVTPDGLRSYLARHLPSFMLPSRFLALESLPVTVNGKTDHAALPDPQLVKISHTAPRSANESTLSAIWAQVFDLPQVGVHDNYFELGGDSLLAIQIVSAAHAAGLQLQPRQLFEQPTIAQLAGCVAGDAEKTPESTSSDSPLPAVSQQDMQQLSAILGELDDELPNDAV